MQIEGVRTPSECVRINWKDAHAYKCEQIKKKYIYRNKKWHEIK